MNNPHIDLWISETHTPNWEREYFKFLADVEKQLGHDLDGDQDADGYSLDFAWAFFDDGLTASEAADEFHCLKALASPTDES